MKFTALMMAAVADAIKVAHETPEEAACKCLMTTGSTIYFPTPHSYDDAYQLVDTPLGDDIQFPWNYGVAVCDAYDEELFGFGCADEDGNIAADADPSCAEPWCYISNECTLYDDKIESSIFDGFVYSYNKCGGDVNGSANDADSNQDDQNNNDDGEGSDDNVVDETGVCDCLTDHGITPNEDGVIVVEYQGETYDYVPSYGLNTCAAHDAGLDPLCTDNAFDYCTAKWCYVSNDCVASDTLPSNFGGANISYSYLNCGNAADFPDNNEIDNNNGADDNGDDNNTDSGADNGDDSNADNGDDSNGERADEDEACDENCGQNEVNINIAFNVDA